MKIKMTAWFCKRKIGCGAFDEDLTVKR